MKNQNLNILMLHSSSDVYGASKIFLITAALLKKNNYNVTAVISDEGPLISELRDQQIEVIVLKLGILRRKYFNLSGLINRYSAFTAAKQKLVDIINQKKIGTVYSNTAGVLVGAFAAKKCNIKHIWHIHEIIEKPALFSLIIGKVINNYSDKVLVVSEEVKKHWSKHIDANKILTIHNGLDYSEYSIVQSSIRKELNIQPHEILIGMVGRVNAWKGQKYFVELATILTKQFNNVKFLMAGDAYPGYEFLQAELNNIIANSGLKHKVLNLGFRNDIPNILNGLDIFVLPSILPDPLPTVVLEAMASHKPVIATAHGGALEMVDNMNTGFLIPWNNAEDAAKCFSYLITDAPTRIKMGNNASKRVHELFSKERYEISILDALKFN
ncbi:glycosyltransferase family 4 protein [Pedobacter lithocola]|uniref:Glycosyltransferase family 4 protein n=1 Tax=Pedobacter lithocola TaxID=1908239 RepID=A0ABV8P6U6_9SPHI